jgi:transcriptional regulator
MIAGNDRGRGLGLVARQKGPKFLDVSAMYAPTPFVQEDRATLLSLAATYPFATVISRTPVVGRHSVPDPDPARTVRAGGTGPGDESSHDPAEDPFGDLVVSHMPLLVDGERAGTGVLRGHLARANPQFEHFAQGAPVLAIFHGPHAYVSPSVYGVHPSVPTWNYVVVHAYGRARLVGEARLRAILAETVSRFDRSEWQLDTNENFLGSMLGAIAGFEVDLDRVEGKWKLSQNRSADDRARVAEWLDRGGEGARACAAMMRGVAAPASRNRAVLGEGS